MSKKRQRKPLDPRVQLGIAIGAPLLVLVVGWMMLVGPQRSKAAQVASQVADAQTQYQVRTTQLLHAPKTPAIQVADIFGLVKAMPDQQDMPGIILQLNQIASDAGISFDSIIPDNGLVPGAGYQIKKVELGFTGNFYGLSDFLYRLRNLVAVRGGKLDASGRLFSVEQLTFGQGKDPFPQIQAQLTLEAYIYGAPASAAPPVVTPSTTDTTQTTTTSTDTTATTTTTSSATAAGAGTGVNG